MWWGVIIGGLLIAVLIAGFSSGAVRMFGSEPSREDDPWGEDEWERFSGC